MESRRVNVRLPDRYHQNLSDWAQRDGSDIAGKASYLLMRSIDSAIVSGELAPASEKTEFEIDSTSLPAAIAYIQALVNSGSINVLDLQKLADGLQIPSEKLAQILKKAKGEITNGNPH